MEKDFSSTMLFNSNDLKRANLKQLLQYVSASLTERGYDPVDQIAGYLISNDPAYISSHNNARSVILKLNRYYGLGVINIGLFIETFRIALEKEKKWKITRF